jgi:hypothetical protein
MPFATCLSKLKLITIHGVELSMAILLAILLLYIFNLIGFYLEFYQISNMAEKVFQLDISKKRHGVDNEIDNTVRNKE